MIACTQEKLAAAIGDVQRMLPAQWEHTGDPDLLCDPNWALYTQLENRDFAALFVMRHDDRAVGYATAMFHPHTNSQKTWVGSIPTYYAEEGPNRGLFMKSLINAARDWLLRKGAHHITVRTRYQQSAGRLLELMGFVPDEIAYKLVLPAKDVAGHS